MLSAFLYIREREKKVFVEYEYVIQIVFWSRCKYDFFFLLGKQRLNL